jgi:hypothetical protein
VKQSKVQKMKKLLCALTCLSVLISSCTKEENLPEKGVVKGETIKDTLRTVITDLKFKLYPTANDQFIFSLRAENNKTYKLYLIENDKELSNSLFVPESNNPGILNTTVSCNFLPYKYYEILIRSLREDKDTVFIEDFPIYGYIHKYANKFNYEKLASITQKLDFDISPSRNVIFYIDYINNKFVLKRLSLTDNKLEILDEDFVTLILRSKNDNELITKSQKYNNRYLGFDSCAIISYDINSKISSFIDWGSMDYGHLSRVVNNKILLSNPIVTNTVSLVNLSDGSKKIFPADNQYLREDNYDQIYKGNDILDFATLNFVNRLPFLSSNSSIAYFDENSQYYITTEYFGELQTTTVYSRMIIFKNDKIVAELPFERGRSFSLPRIINMSDNKLIFHQSYEYDSDVKLDGYYLLDISTNKLTLLQNDNNNYVKYDFFTGIDKNTFISIRPYEIFRITV